MHWKLMLDPSVYLGAQDFPKEKTVKIGRVVREEMPERDKNKKATSAPMIYFTHNGAELPRKLKVPRTVMYGLNLLLGVDTDSWIGKDITLYATRCDSFGDVEECIRVRFPAEIDEKILRMLKKKKANLKTYTIDSKL